MKKPYVLFAALFLFSIYSHAQTHQWTAQIGGNNEDSGEDIAIDASGNVYMVGSFLDTADFDPGPGVFNIASAGFHDVFVVKLDANKNFIWAVSIAGSESTVAYAIRIANNSIYVAGHFWGTVDFDPGPGSDSLVAAGGSDIFVLKLDTASDFIWVKQIGGSGNDGTRKMTMDNNENILVCGEFQDTVDFDPGPNVQNFISITSADGYVLKLDSAGNQIWAGRFGNVKWQYVHDLVTDAANDVYVTGQFRGTMDVDPGNNVYNLSAAGGYDKVFLFKWTSSGNFIWAFSLGSNITFSQGIALEVDAANNPIITGAYYGTLDMDPGPNVYNLVSNGAKKDIFLAKYSAGNGSVMFAKTMGGTANDVPFAIDLDPSGAIFIAGAFKLTADFDPDVPVYNLTGIGQPADAFVARYDPAGQFISASRMGSINPDYAKGLTIHGYDVYSCGVFNYIVDFDPSTGSDSLSSFSNSPDAFLLKTNYCVTVQDTQQVSLCPGDSVFAGGNYQLAPGTFMDTYISVYGCDSIVTSIVQYTFALSLGNDIDTCEGTFIQLSTIIPGASYLWNTGDTTAFIFPDTTGNYMVAVTYNGCTQYDSVNVNYKPLPFINLGNDTIICIDDSITLDAGSGFAGYVWHNGSTGQTYSLSGPLPVGTYSVSVMITGINGCMNADTMNVVVRACTGMEEVGNESVVVYPQPAADYVFIKGNGMMEEITLFTLEGKELLRLPLSFGNKNVKIQTVFFENGIYFLQIQGEGFFKVMKIVVQH